MFLAIGLMTFALFLGAGNMIFPPYLGQVSGSDLIITMAGFLLTGVGLPLLGVVATARLGGGLNRFTQDLPKWITLLFGFILYLAIGPLFAAPRTAVVAWEMSFADYFGGSEYGQMIYSAVFFGMTLWLALFPGRLIDTVGKIITPMLIVVLMAIAIGVVFFPLGPVGSITSSLGDSVFSWGFQQGYQTMDTLASLAFGIVIITAFKDRGVTDTKTLTKSTITAGLIAATGLASVYIILALLGATSHSVIPDATNGADILATYIGEMYGFPGTVLLGVTITLACLTTSIGVITACGEYFSGVIPGLSYRACAVICTVVSAMIANIGLNELLALTIPALLIIYPVAIALIILALIRHKLFYPARTYSLTLIPVFIVSLIDGLAASGVGGAEIWAKQYLSALPLHADSLGWLIPGIAGFAVSCIKKPMVSER